MPRLTLWNPRITTRVLTMCQALHANRDTEVPDPYVSLPCGE